MNYIFDIVSFPPATFVLSWILACFVFSRFGWSALSKRYRTDLPFPDDSLGFVTVTLNGVRNRGTIKLTANDEGLHLKVLFIFRLFNPPLFIPWRDIMYAGEEKGILSKTEIFRLGLPPVAIMKIDQDLYLKLKKYLDFK